jgi:hypothetical protein
VAELGTFMVRVDDGGEYLVMSDDADLDSLHEADLPDYRGIVAGTGVAVIRILGGEETEFVEVEVAAFDEPPDPSELQAMYAAWADVDSSQLRTNGPLELRSVEQEPIVTVAPPRRHWVAVCRNPAPEDRIERHKLIVFPDPMEWLRSRV